MQSRPSTARPAFIPPRTPGALAKRPLKSSGAGFSPPPSRPRSRGGSAAVSGRSRGGSAGPCRGGSLAGTFGSIGGVPAASGAFLALEPQLARALEELFAVYDADGDGYVDVNEFVRAQRLLADGTGRAPDNFDALAHFLASVNFVGDTDGLGFDEFATWQMQLLRASGARGSHELTVACRWLTQRILDAHAGAAGSSLSAVRLRRACVRTRPGGGGHTSSRRGFVERRSDVLYSLNDFDRNAQESSGESSVEALEGADPAAELSEQLRERLQQLRAQLRRARRRQVGSTAALELSRSSSAESGLDVATLKEQMRACGRECKQAEAGKFTLRGSVRSQRKAIPGASVEVKIASDLLHASAEKSWSSSTTTSTNQKGTYAHTGETLLGRAVVVTARKDGFASNIRRIGGEGVREVHLELLPLSVTSRFRSAAGDASMHYVQDHRTKVGFRIPIGGLLKEGEPFSGEAVFSSAIEGVLPSESGALNADCVASLPVLVGRSLAGARMRLESMGAFFIGLSDALDGCSLTLREGSSIAVALPTRAAPSQRAPAVWLLSEDSGEWQQTNQPLSVNGSELPAVSPWREALYLRGADSQLPESAVLHRERIEAAKVIRAGQLAVDVQQKREFAQRMCTCGFHGKRAIMPLVHQNRSFALADPPKRIFAEVDLNSGRRDPSTGSPAACLVFPYHSHAERRESAEKAQLHSDVLLSHHLVNIQQEFGSEWRRASRVKRPPPVKLFRSVEYVADWLLHRARAVDVASGETLDDIDTFIFELKVLELLANTLAQPSHSQSTGATPLELRDFLRIRGGGATGIARAFFDVMADQVDRDNVAFTRELLRRIDPQATVPFNVALSTFHKCDDDEEAAANMLAGFASIKLRADKARVRQCVHDMLPVALPTDEQLEEILAQSLEKRRSLEDELARRRAAASAARSEADSVEERLSLAQKAFDDANEAYDQLALKTSKKMLRQETANAKIARKAAEDAEASAADTERRSKEALEPRIMAEELLLNPEVLESAKRTHQKWEDVQESCSDVNYFGFQVGGTGWVSVGATVEAAKSFESVPTSKAPPAEVEEFFPHQPLPICPVRASTLVLGSFDTASMVVASAGGLDHIGLDVSEAVQPDGTFTVLALAGHPFEVRGQKRDGATGAVFGPFVAAGPNDVMHVGLLEAPRDDCGASWQKTPRRIEILLPRLEFPPHGPGAHEAGTCTERCTCFDAADDED